MSRVDPWPESDAAAEEQTAEAQASCEPLPFHLILGRLPVRQIFQVSCVCKDWYSMLGAGEFLPTAGEEYWFVMVKPPCLLHHGHGERRVWDFVAFSSHSKFPKANMNDWTFFELPLHSPRHSKLLTLLGGVHCPRLAMYTAGAPHDKSCPCLVSVGGLMCAFVEKQGTPDDYHVIVFNLLTGAVKVLPPVLNHDHLFGRVIKGVRPPAPHFCYIHMAFDDQDPDRYYIMLTHEDIFWDLAYFEVFDSRSGCWRVGQNPEPANNADFKSVSEGDFFRENFINGRQILFAYHASEDVWSEVCTPKIRLDDVGPCPTFHKYKGRLLCGSRLCRMVSITSVTLGFVVYELQPVTSKFSMWVEVARTPEHLWQWAKRSEWNQIIKTEGSLFYMELERKDKGQSRPPLVYDLMQDLWYVLPSDTCSTNLGSILVHRPRLSMRMTYLPDGTSAA